MKKLLFCAFLATHLLAVPATFNELASYDPSRARDFATLLYMEKELDIIKNRTLFYRLTAPKPAHIDKLLERTNDKGLQKLQACRSKGTKELLSASSDCQVVAMSPARAEHLSSDEKLLVASKIAQLDPFKAEIFRAMASENPFATNDSDLFFAITLAVSFGFLESIKEHQIPSDLIKAISKDSRVAKLLEKLATTQKAPSLANALKKLDIDSLDTTASFYLGILSLDNTNIALKAFQRSEKTAYNQTLLNRAIFWQYTVLQDKSLLAKLANSSSVDFYALYAKDLMGVNYPAVIRSVGGGSHISQVKEKDLYSPFYWAEILRKINQKQDLSSDLSQLGTSKKYEPYRAAIKHWRDGSHLFLDPYADLMSRFESEEKALFLAIMRQESRFIPAALSTSYAMGTMQMMPFLTEHMKKEHRDKRALWEFFDPNHQIPYAKKHLDWLSKKLAHPLYIAYAYNGGIGYTNRTIEGYKLFARGKYEPFLSMERITVEETREYGKIVLANYAIYLDLFGKKQKLTDLVQMLTPTGEIVK